MSTMQVDLAVAVNLPYFLVPLSVSLSVKCNFFFKFTCNDQILLNFNIVLLCMAVLRSGREGD